MATRKAPTQRKPTRARKTPVRRKSPTSKQSDFAYTSNVIAVVALLLEILAVGQFGLVGKFMANLVRYVVGGSYQAVLIILAMFLLYVAVYGKWPKVRLRIYGGLGLFYLGFMLAGAILLFNEMQTHTDMINTIGRLIAQDMSNKATTTPVGGGVIGAAILSVTYIATANWGSWILAVFAMLAGIVIFFNLPVKELLTGFFGASELAGNVVADQARQVVSSGAAKVEELKSNYQAKRESTPYDFAPASGTDSAADAEDVEAAVDLNKTVATTMDEFKMPEIVAPAPIDLEESNLAPLHSVASYAPDNAVATNDDLASLTAAMPDDEAPSDFAPLSHVDALRGPNENTSPKTTAHQTDVGHVEPSTKSVPSEDVVVSGFGKVPDDRNYQLPTTTLLTKVGSTDQSKERNQLEEKSRILQQTFVSFNIKVTVEKVVLGPTITQYEIKPAIGVKVSKITNLADDLALALAAKSLRIEAPIPGKSLVGIEVANDQQAMVGFRDMMDKAGVNTKNVLTVPIGKSVTGEIIKMNLTKMPHLLIAGSTGSGKSVAINSILASILLQAKPSEVRLMLVDPKQVELNVYNDIPHLITPVVSEPRKAAAALKKVVVEMDNRFKALAETGMRNIAGYNDYVDKQAAQGVVMQKMPYLVVVIDELADLMMTVSGEVEPAIVRIAQLGRAAGIHMIVATQRPSVDVITGLIKANVPSRMAFAVGSGVDSRTILDSNGAEKLLGRGDMLFNPIGANSPLRVQGAFLSDEDVASLTNFVKHQGTAQYDEAMEITDSDLAVIDGETGAGTTNDLDENWDAAIDFVNLEGKGSASMLQRHFRMGYNRAARLNDDLIAAGVLAPKESQSKPSRVLMTKEQYYAQQAAAQAINNQ